MAGFIPELVTRVTVNMNTSELDAAIDKIASDPILSECDSIIDELTNRKNQLEGFKEPIGLSVAERLSSIQENIISSKHYINGMAANSVDIMLDGDDYLVGNTATSVDGFPYPLALEKGRRAVFPINRKYLRWFENGDFSSPVFAKYSSSVAPDPFVQPSIDDTLYDIDSIVDDILNGL